MLAHTYTHTRRERDARIDKISTVEFVICYGYTQANKVHRVHAFTVGRWHYSDGILSTHEIELN